MTFTARMYTNLGTRIGIEPQEWRDQAACRDADSSIFFPERGGFDYDALIDQALAFCRRCPVRGECYEFGRSEQHGIWGGVARSYRNPIDDRRTA